MAWRRRRGAKTAQRAAKTQRKGGLRRQKRRRRKNREGCGLKLASRRSAANLGGSKWPVKMTGSGGGAALSVSKWRRAQSENIWRNEGEENRNEMAEMKLWKRWKSKKRSVANEENNEISCDNEIISENINQPRRRENETGCERKSSWPGCLHAENEAMQCSEEKASCSPQRRREGWRCRKWHREAIQYGLCINLQYLEAWWRRKATRPEIF